MAYYPNCSIELPLDAESCRACGAEFGLHSAWRPRSHPWQGSAAIRVRSSPPLSLFTRLCGTAWMLICVAVACFFVVAFGVFSAPGGLANSSFRTSAFFAGAYVLLALYGTMQLWTRPQFTTLFLVTALLPLFFVIILPLLVLLSV